MRRPPDVQEDSQPRGSSPSELSQRLLRAIRSGDVSVWYQPVVDVRDGAILRLEALARWSDAPTERFVRAAEEDAIVHELDLHVLRVATSQVAAWKARGFPCAVSINFSALTMTTPAVLDAVRAALAESGLAARDLVIEITETAATDERALCAVSTRFDAAGIRVSIDDFGIGHTSLAGLSRSGAGEVKIDRSFVAGYRDERTAHIVIAVVEMAKAIGARVVAEGVETLPQLQWAASLGCHAVQGHLLARAMPATATTALLERATMHGRRILDAVPVHSCHGTSAGRDRRH